MIYKAIDYWNSPPDSYLEHHGVKGMKWGVRKQRSLKGTLHRLAAANYGLNERTYRKLGNNTLASMNAAARTNSLKKAEAADAAKQKKIQNKMAVKAGKIAAARSIKGYGARALSSVYALNERTYSKLGNRVLASMNSSAKNKWLKKANSYDEEFRRKQRQRLGL